MTILFSIPEGYSKGSNEGNDNKASSPLTTNFTLTSNYMFRGISQSMNAPAAQGSLMYTVPHIGIYGEIWGSNLKNPELSLVTGDDVANESLVQVSVAHGEIDTGIGIANTFKEISYDVSLYRYIYPQSVNLSYNEFLASMQWHIVTAMLGYSGDVYSTGAKGVYYNLGFSYNLPSEYLFNITELNLTGGIGHYTLPSYVNLKSYNDFSVQLSKKFGKAQLMISWSDTDGRAVDLPAFADSKLVFSATVNFS